MKVKICGIKNIETASVISECDCDYVGFIFAKNSKRTIDFDMAKQIGQKLKPSIKKVGVFVDENIETVQSAVDNKIIDIVQLHGNENSDYIMQLKQRCGVYVIKAVKVKDTHEIVGDYKMADAVLVDYYSIDAQGGVGKSFDWQAVDFSQFGKEVFLAGGINLSNIESAKNLACITALDISSGAETDGQKDGIKIRQLISIAKS